MMDLVLVPATVCPECGTAISQLHVEQPALFFHAGYGANKRTIHRICSSCGWWICTEISEVAP